MIESTLPEKLNRAIKELLQLMQQRPDHTLLPRERRLVYACFENNKIYCHLALLIARRVLPLLEKSLPKNTLPKEIIEFIERILEGKLTASLIDEESEYFEYDERYLSLPYNWIWTEGGYALSTIYNAMNVVSYNRLPFQYLNQEELEQGLPDELCQGTGDVASTAVRAYSGINLVTFNLVFSEILQAKQGPYFDPEKRRQFWEWWLTEAIEQAWKLAQSTSDKP